MRKRVFGRQLKRDTNERNALFKSLMHELVIHETIITTEAKAKSVRGQVEKFVTRAKKNPEEAMRVLQSHFAVQSLAKLVNEIAPRFVGRNGGYTRIVKIGNRVNDNAKIVMLEWTEKGNGRLKNKTNKLRQDDAPASGQGGEKLETNVKSSKVQSKKTAKKATPKKAVAKKAKAKKATAKKAKKK